MPLKLCIIKEKQTLKDCAQSQKRKAHTHTQREKEREKDLTPTAGQYVDTSEGPEVVST